MLPVVQLSLQSLQPGACKWVPCAQVWGVSSVSISYLAIIPLIKYGWKEKNILSSGNHKKLICDSSK